MKLCGWLLGLVMAVSPAAGFAGETSQEEAERWVLVLEDPRPARKQGWSGSPGYQAQRSYDNDPALRRLTRNLLADYPVELVEAWPVRSLDAHCLVVELKPGTTEAVLASISEDSRVRWVQRMNNFEGSALPRAGTEPYLELQTSLALMNVAPLRNRLSGQGVLIAVVDSLIERDHPDLKHAIARHDDFVRPGEKTGPERHGTGMAGVMVASDSNGVGIAGIAPDARIHAIRACWEMADGRTRCDSLTLSRALEALIDDPVHLVNLSLTGPPDRLLDALLEKVLAQRTVVIVAHDDVRRPDARFPTPREGIVPVASGSADALSDMGVIPAPGDGVLTAQPGHSYDFMTGHSVAAAHVTGILALMIEAGGVLSPAEVRQSLADAIRHGESQASVDACLAVTNSPEVCHPGEG